MHNLTLVIPNFLAVELRIPRSINPKHYFQLVTALASEVAKMRMLIVSFKKIEKCLICCLLETPLLNFKVSWSGVPTQSLTVAASVTSKQVCIVLFVLFCEQLKLKLSTYLFSTTITAPGCLLIERSVVKSQATAALKRVLGHDAKLLSKNVQWLPLIRLMRVFLTRREKHLKKGMFFSLSAAS